MSVYILYNSLLVVPNYLQEPTSNKKGNVNGNSLEDDADSKDACVKDHGPATAQNIGQWSTEQSAEEGACRQDRHNLGCLAGGHIGKVILGIDVAGREKLSPVVHCQNAANGPSIISEKDTTKGDEGT
jgi:hypothetical protein